MWTHLKLFFAIPYEFLLSYFGGPYSLIQGFFLSGYLMGT